MRTRLEALTLASLPDHLLLSSIDVDEYPEIAFELGVKATPALKLFKGDQKSFEYLADVTSIALTSWVTKQLGGGIMYLSTAEDATRLLSESPRACVGYFPSFNLESMETFRSLDRIVSDVPFAYTSDAKVAKIVGLESESVKVTMSEKIFSSNLNDSVLLYRSIVLWSSPLVTEFDSLSVRSVFSSPSPVLFVLVLANETFTPATAETVREFGLLLVRVVVPADSPSQALLHLIEFLGASRTGPGGKEMWILEAPKNPSSRKFRYQVSHLSHAAIEQFVSAYSESLLDPFLKSEIPEPLTPRMYEAIPVVGRSYLEFLKIDDKRKLLLFYAPWCGACASAVELIDALARTAPDSGMIAGKIDMSRNDISGVGIAKFPTLVFYSKIGGEQREFYGPWTLADVHAWMYSMTVTGASIHTS